ncbi:copper-containing nitrite reductase [Pleionea sediminis]|uniref:copper-containing nitrite reductase n=1 Tax=Pleionea sediminis TaxID=2569479 RepID=UPI0011865649|nr:copper-containing nitrite reductase [Pleionea sediminis]
MRHYFLLTVALMFLQPAISLERIQQTLVPPPLLPAHELTSPGQPKIIEVTLTIEEKELEIDDGVFIQALTFNGSVPAPMIVAHEGDYVEVTLVNPATNTMRHNIDFHSATGAMGGAALTNIAPGEQAILRFKATKTGVFVYHCAPGGDLTPYHVVAGMNGAMMVLPKDGLRDGNNQRVTYDKAYYIGEQDFYVPQDAQGNFRRFTNLADALEPTFEVMRTLTPSHVVFNGRKGALLGANALTANVGDNVLLIHSQATRDSRPHIVGGHADWVWQAGSFANRALADIETWFVPGGSAVAALYEFKQPGTYVYVNHNLIEAILLGAAAQIEVSGDWDNDLMMQVQPPSPIP